MVKRGINLVVKPKKLTSREIQIALLENFVNMQKVLTNLTIKFDGLSDNISKLLQLFEISAKSFLQKNDKGQFEGPTEDKALLGKLDTLLDQNKTIATGLTLIEEKIRHKIYGEHIGNSEEHEVGRKPAPKPLPRI